MASLIADKLALADDRCQDTLFIKVAHRTSHQYLKCSLPYPYEVATFLLSHIQRYIFDAGCLKVIVAKGLGWAMTLASALVKAPQIKNMVSVGSSAGVSPASVYMETFMYMCSVSYYMGKDLEDGKIDAYNE